MDYRDFEPKRAIRVDDQTWWRREKDKAHEPLFAAAKHLEEAQSYRQSDNLRHMRLYGNLDIPSFGPRDYARSETAPRFLNRIAINVVASCTDTLVAKIAKNRPKPSFLTEDGDHAMQQKAKLLNKFTQGAMYETKLAEDAPMIATDACIFGTGVEKFYEADNRIRAERVLPDELLVDDAEAKYGQPRQLFQSKAIARELLLETYGEDEETRAAIIRANRAEDGTGYQLSNFGDLLLVREAWHLPSGEKAGDGRHVIAIENATLLDEEWTKPYFPFAFLRFIRRPLGFWGQGIAERLMGIQIEINRLLLNITEALRLMSKPKYLVEASSKLSKGHIRGGSTEAIGEIITFTGPTPPSVWAPNVVPPEQFAQLDRLITRAYEEIGVSQLSAASMKPAGLDSGAALREHHDIETERFVLFGQQFEQWVMDSNHLLIDLARDIAKRNGGSYPVSVPQRSGTELIDWKHINLERDQYIMQMFPVSSLPTTPEGRLQAVQDLLNGGFIEDKAEARRLLDMPDLDASGNLAVAAIDDADATIDAILEKGEYEPLEEFQDANLVLKRATGRYLRARRLKVPDDRLELLRNLITDAANKVAAAQPQPQAAPAGPPQPGAPMPPDAAGAPPPIQ